MVHGYSKGLNKDMSPMKTDPNSLHHAVNVHLRTDDGDSSLAIINGKGNKQLVITDAELYSRLGYSIINIESVRTDLVVLWANTDNSGFGIIDKLIHQSDGSYIRVELYKSVDFDTNLEFFPNQPLAVAVNYRSTHDVKLYVTGENYPFHVFDVAPKYETPPILESSYKLKGKLVTAFLRIPHVKFSTPSFNDYVAGGLYEGVYQYAYRLVTKNNITTSISPASLRIPVTSTVNATHTSKLFGSTVGGSINSGIGVKMQLDLSAISINEFEYAEIFSLYYSDSTQLPTINIIERIPITSTSVSFIDETNEAKYGTILYDEFVSVISDFSASCLSVKDSRLFAANVKNTVFDINFDARAYRADESGDITLVHNGVTYPITKVGLWPDAEYKVDLGEGLVNIPEDFDCINPANHNDLDKYDITQQYVHTSTKIVFGGEGSNIRYVIGSNEGDTYFKAESSVYYNNMGNPTLLDNQVGVVVPKDSPKAREYILGMTRSFKTGETYRFGIVFFNDLGIASPVKWIGDIIISDTALGAKVPKFIKFTVNTANTSAYNLNFQIVYVPLTDDTRRVLSEGIAGTLANAGVNGTTRIIPNPVTYSFRQHSILDARTELDADYYAFDTNLDKYPLFRSGVVSLDNALTVLSPEGGFGTILSKTGLKVRRIGTQWDISAATIGDFRLNAWDDFKFPKSCLVVANGNSIENFINSEHAQKYMSQYTALDVEDIVNVNYDTSGEPLLINGVSNFVYSNKANQQVDGSPLSTYPKVWITGNQLAISTINPSNVTSVFDGLSATYSIYKHSSPFTDHNGDKYIPEGYVNVRLFRTLTPYLGEDYTSRLNSVYVPASAVSSNSSSLWANNGDVTISYMDCLTSMYPSEVWGDTDTNEAGTAVMTDRAPSLLRNVYFMVESTINCFMQSDASMHKGGYSLYNDKPVRGLLQTKGSATGDLYKYNQLHSQPDKSKLYVPVDNEFQKNTAIDTQIRWSEADLEGSGVDYMSVFKTNNYKNANNNYGPINALTSWKDNLFIHQDEAFASLSINPMATQVGSDGSTIVLGQGNTLDKINYISSSSGSQKGSDIVLSPKAMYWLDRFKNKVYLFNGSVVSLSDVQGMSGFFKNATSAESYLKGIYDAKMNTVFLTIQQQEVVESTVDYSEEVSYVRDVVNVTTVEEIVKYTTTSSFTINAVTEDSWVELTFNGVTSRFTCVDIVADAKAEFLKGADVNEATINLTNAINLKLTSTGELANYTLSYLDNVITISSLAKGEVFNMSPKVNNAVISFLGSGVASGGVGEQYVTPQNSDPVVVNDGSWIVVDYSSAGGVDRVDIYKNGVLTSQSGCYQASNNGYPDVTISNPRIVDRTGTILRTLYKGVWDNLVTYVVGDLVSHLSNIYVAKEVTLGGDPSVSPSWEIQPVAGSLDTHDWNSDPVADKYTFYQAFVGTNSQLIGGAGLGSADGLVPTRYEDYLNAGGLPSNVWLGEEGDVAGGGTIKDGVISHYSGVGYPEWGRGQRVWMQADAGDTYRVVVMGSGLATGWELDYFEITPSESDIRVLDLPTTDVTVERLEYTTTTVTVTPTITKTYTTREVNKVDNRYGVLSILEGVTYRLSSLTSPFVLNYQVEYELAGGVFTVQDINHSSNYVDLKLIAGSPTLGLVDVEEFITFHSPFTIAYDEQLNVFSSFWSFIPSIYASSSDGILTSNDDYSLYSHNSLPYNTYYGNIHDSYFDIVITGNTVAELLNIEAYVYAESNGEYLPNKGIYSVKAWSNGQESDELVLYAKDGTRIFKDSEGTRIPNQGITTGNHPYSTLYNASKNADKVWRIIMPRIREDLIVALDTVEYRNRALGSSVKIRFKLKAEGDNTRIVIEDVNILGEIVKL